MSDLILPNRQAPVKIEFNMMELATGDMVLQASWSSGMIQLPPIAPEVLKGIAEHIAAGVDKVIAKRMQANGSILTLDGSRAEGF